MRTYYKIIAFLAFAAGHQLSTAYPAIADMDDDAIVRGASAMSDSELSEFLESDFVSLFSDASVLAAGPDAATIIAERAKELHQSLELSAASEDINYDVIIQAGHFPRKKGVTGGEGRLVWEQHMTVYIGALLLEYLLASDVNAVLVPADDFGSNLKSRIFVALHTDSAPSGRHCTLGPSVGYKTEGSDAKGMHGLAFATAVSLDLSINNFMRDSYTKGLQGYYAFSSVRTELFEGVLEMIELTCERQEVSLLSNSERLASNLSQAILWALREPVTERQ